MSVYQPMDVTCRCGQSFSIDVVHGVNIDRLPDVRNNLIDGTFHTALCPSCGLQSVIEREFLYSDFARNAFFKVKPRKARHQWQKASAELDDDVTKIPKEISNAGNRHCRVVFGLGELREKLVAQDAGIDDRFVELAKVYLVYEHPFLLQKPRLRLQLNKVHSHRLDFSALQDHAEEMFEITMPRAIFDDLAGREPEIRDWLGSVHKRSSIFGLQNDYWINMWRWSPQTTALRDLGVYAEAARSGGPIDWDSDRFQRMLTYLPRGRHLPGWAKRALRDVNRLAQDQDIAPAVDRTFEIRFDMGLDDDWALNNNPDDIDTLWDLLRDLPDANVEGNTFISAIQLMSGDGGYYSPQTHEIVIGEDELWAKERFQDVVRHEVGHAVQEKRDQNDNQVTDWLTSRFGWQDLWDNNANIDLWVGLMGGYRDLTQTETDQVRQLLRLCLGPGEQWSPPNIPHVPADHPWRKPGFGPRLAF
jgi:hypothetical protein